MPPLDIPGGTSFGLPAHFFANTNFGGFGGVPSLFSSSLTNFSSAAPSLTSGFSSGGGSSFLGGLNSFLGSPAGQFGSLLGFGALQGLASGKSRDKELQSYAEQQALNRALESQLQSQQLEASQRTQAANMAGPSPLAHQNERARLDILNRFLTGSFRPTVTPPAGVPQGSIDWPTFQSPFLTAGAMANAEVPYQQAQRSLNPSLPTPDLSKIGYGGAGVAPSQLIEEQRVADDQRRQQDRDALLKALLG